MPIARLIVVAATLGLAATPTLAADPAYVGTWGVSAAQCKLPQDVLGAPLVIRAKGYDQHEAHCDFTSVKKVGNAWRVKAACSVEGDKQKDAFTLQVSGKTLTLKQGKSARAYMRCG